MLTVICAKHDGIWYAAQVELIKIVGLIQQKKKKIAYKLPDGTIISFDIPFNLDKPKGTSKTEVITSLDDGVPCFEAIVATNQSVADKMYTDC